MRPFAVAATLLAIPLAAAAGDEAGLRQQFALPNFLAVQAPLSANAAQNPLSSSWSVLDVLLGKRVTVCPTGYGLCYWGECCPADNNCCGGGGGFCLIPGYACCPEGACPPGQGCCGYSNCYPHGQVCCGNGGYCPAGNICVAVHGNTADVVCCTDTSCTAYVEGGTTIGGAPTAPATIIGTGTTTAPTTPAQPTATSTGATGLNTYYFYISWFYYVYYWAPVITVDASVVTSSITYTTTTFTVEATDSAAASLSFEAISTTFASTTPAAATSLESLAGSTSYAAGAGPTTATTSSAGSVAGGGGAASGASRLGEVHSLVVVSCLGWAAAVGVLMVLL